MTNWYHSVIFKLMKIKFSIKQSKFPGMQTELDIRNAIKNDELVFFYQPKVSLITGKINGAEALKIRSNT